MYNTLQEYYKQYRKHAHVRILNDYLSENLVNKFGSINKPVYNQLIAFCQYTRCSKNQCFSCRLTV